MKTFILSLLIFLAGISTDPRASDIDFSISASSNLSKSECLDKALENAVRNQDFRGAVIAVQNNEIILCKGYGPGITPQTRFLIGSLSKQFTGIAILSLIDKGKLSLDDTLRTLLPQDILDPAWDKITVRQLLRHQTGLPNYGPSDDDNKREKPFQPTDVLQMVMGQSLAFPPGTKSQYCNTNYLILGMIIEAISEKTYSDYLQTTFFEPLAMTNTGYNPEIPDDFLAKGTLVIDGEEKKVFDHFGIIASKAFAAGGIYTTVEDLYKWYQALTNDQVLTPMMREEILTTPPKEVIDSDSSVKYNAGFIIKQDPSRLSHDGNIAGFYACMSYYLDSGDFLIVLSNNSKKERVNGKTRSATGVLFRETLIPLFEKEDGIIP